MLFKEPGSILSYFGILSRNTGGLYKMGQDVCQAPEYNSEFMRLARERWTLKKAICDMEEVDDVKRIRVRDLNPRQEALSKRKIELEGIKASRRAVTATW